MGNAVADTQLLLLRILILYAIGDAVLAIYIVVYTILDGGQWKCYEKVKPVTVYRKTRRLAQKVLSLASRIWSQVVVSLERQQLSPTTGFEA